MGKPPIFILGSQRSGTTMLRLMLNNHPRVAVPHESGFIVEVFRKLDCYGDLANRDAVRLLLDDVCKNMHVRRGKLIPDREAVLGQHITCYADFIDAVFRRYAQQFGKERWGDKTPSYTEDIEVIRQIFPAAKIIHIVRDGRDVIVSQKSIQWASQNFLKLVQDWRWKVTIAHKVGAVLGNDFCEIRYEDLVQRPEETLRCICDFIGETYDPAMLSYSENAREVVPQASLKWHHNSIRPPDLSQLGRWKTILPRAERIIFEQLAGDTLDLFGYEREHLQPTFDSRLRKVYYTLFKRN